ncbi:hypothetical protein TNCV_1718571 [Trichonephila clavipes]|nr:hypothetical protein TNCV_1718571 [Trichonephila clavipes]
MSPHSPDSLPHLISHYGVGTNSIAIKVVNLLIIASVRRPFPSIVFPSESFFSPIKLSPSASGYPFAFGHGPYSIFSMETLSPYGFFSNRQKCPLSHHHLCIADTLIHVFVLIGKNFRIPQTSIPPADPP